MTLDSLLQRWDLSLEPATLDDTASDWERLDRAARSRLGGRPLQATLPALRQLGPAMRSGGWTLRVVVADVGEAWRVIAVEPGGVTAGFFGLALDLGTTTLVAELIDLETGRVLASRLALNAQREFGTDVTSRMMYAERPGGLAALRQVVLSTLNELIAGLCSEIGASPDRIAGIVVAGNTVMVHLLLGLDPSSIRREPYVPATRVFPVLNAVEVGISIGDGALAYSLPAASGYVGGDVTAGVLATGLADEETLSILIDIGTNGETVLGNREFLMAVSGSAGSAFEGCGLEWGMAAQAGAIDRVWVEGDQIAYRTIEDQPPKGVCGSGLIQALGSFLKSGAIDRGGKVNVAAPGARSRDGHPEIVLAPAGETAVGRDIALRQADIENLIRDKAALYAGSRILLASAGLSFDAVQRILIAGNFGQSLEVEQAVRIGLLPDIPRERMRFIGNSSLAGARAALLSRAEWARAGEIAASTTCLELTVDPGYFEEYTAALFLPHTDLRLFPSSLT